MNKVINERLRTIEMILRSSTSTRKEVSIVMKEEGDYRYNLYQQMWRDGLLRTGTLGWICLTKKGLKELEWLEKMVKKEEEWK